MLCLACDSALHPNLDDDVSPQSISHPGAVGIVLRDGEVLTAVVGAPVARLPTPPGSAAKQPVVPRAELDSGSEGAYCRVKLAWLV